MSRIDGQIEGKLRALPVQVVEWDRGVILKRGCTEFRIDGPESKKIVQSLLLAVSEGGATPREICECFPAPYRTTVEELIHHLATRRILVPADAMEHAVGGREDSLEVFYWHFGYRPEEVAGRLNERRIAIMGVNCISRRLVAALNAAAVTSVEVVDYPLLRNVRLFDDRGNLCSDQWPVSTNPPVSYGGWEVERGGDRLHCLVGTSDFGGMQLMREWNRYCVEENLHFLPVVLQNLVGYVGPLVVPGETACFECLRARQNSHLADPEAERAAEYQAFEGQLVNGFHPSMASVLGDIAALELTKFYGQVPRWRVGTLIEVRLLEPSVAARKVLRIPRCSVCSTLNRRASVRLEKGVYLPPNDHAPVG